MKRFILHGLVLSAALRCYALGQRSVREVCVRTHGQRHGGCPTRDSPVSQQHILPVRARARLFTIMLLSTEKEKGKVRVVCGGQGEGTARTHVPVAGGRTLREGGGGIGSGTHFHMTQTFPSVLRAWNVQCARRPARRTCVTCVFVGAASRFRIFGIFF